MSEFRQSNSLSAVRGPTIEGLLIGHSPRRLSGGQWQRRSRRRDRYFLSDRIRMLKAIRAKIRHEPAREPPPPPPKPLCSAAGECCEAKGRRATISGQSRRGRARIRMIANNEAIAVRL
jgi:hypothetical protein